MTSSAWDAALALLKHRGRSYEEMAARLSEKGFEKSTIDGTLDRLAQAHLLNDTILAGEWADQWRRKGWGEEGLRLKLEARGFGSDIIHRLVEAGGAAERERAQRELTRRAQKLKGVTGPARRARLYGQLKSRGFSQDAIDSALASDPVLREDSHEF